MRTELFPFDEEPLSVEVLNLIEGEVQKNVSTVDDDAETTEFAQDYERDYKTHLYRFLSWINKTEQPARILYAGSGSDPLPKFVFGEDKVIHTSLEQYNKVEDKKYFPELGTGNKVVAENQLPFPESSFEVALLLGLPEEIIGDQIPEATRTLKPGGLIVIGTP